MGWQPSLRRSRPRWIGNMLRCLPLQWQERNLGRAQYHESAYIDDGPVGDPDANLRLYDFLKEKNQRSSHFMIGTNVHDNLQRRSGPHRSPLYGQRAGYGRSNIDRQSSNQYADWYDQYSHCLLSLLTFLSSYYIVLPWLRSRYLLYHHPLYMLPSLRLSFLPAFLH